MKAIFTRFSTALALVLAVASTWLAPTATTALGTAALLAPSAADAALTLRASAKTAMMQAIITDAGNGAKLKLYNGTKPASLGAVTGGNTLLATLTWTGVPIGTATAGTIDFDEAGATQNNGSHFPGTPTFARITTSADVVVFDIDIGVGAGNWQFSGTVATGQNVTLTGLVISAGN